MIERTKQLIPLETLIGTINGKYKDKVYTFQIFYGNACLPFVDGKMLHLNEKAYYKKLEEFFLSKEGQEYIIPPKSEILAVCAQVIENDKLGMYKEARKEEPKAEAEERSMDTDTSDQTGSSVENPAETELKNDIENIDTEKSTESEAKRDNDGTEKEEQVIDEKQQEETLDSETQNASNEDVVNEENSTANIPDETEEAEKEKTTLKEDVEETSTLVTDEKVSVETDVEVTVKEEIAEEPVKEDDEGSINSDADKKEEDPNENLTSNEKEISVTSEDDSVEAEKEKIEENTEKYDPYKNSIDAIFNNASLNENGNENTVQSVDEKTSTDVDKNVDENLNINIENKDINLLLKAIKEISEENKKTSKRIDAMIASEEERIYIPVEEDITKEQMRNETLELVKEELIKNNTKLEKNNKLIKNLLCISVIFNLIIMILVPVSHIVFGANSPLSLNNGDNVEVHAIVHDSNGGEDQYSLLGTFNIENGQVVENNNSNPTESPAN